MSLPPIRNRFRDRRGIALLLVLVMATLLAAVAVSMVSTLRVDRMASVNYMDSVTVRSAVPDVVDDVLRNLPYQTVGIGASVRLSLDHRPPNNGFYAMGGAPGAPALSPADRASLLTPETLQYFTPDHRNPASAPFQTPLWKSLGPNLRYFALLEDQSGLLDLDGLRLPPGSPPLPRITVGRDCLHAADVNFSHVWTLDGGMGAPPLMTNHFGRLPGYENTAEIRTYATSQNPGEGKLFTTFSHNPQGTFSPTLQRLDRLEITRYNPSMRQAFITQMNAMGFGGKSFRLAGAPVMTQSEVLWDMYTDYTDTNDSPSNPYVANEVAAFVSELQVPILLQSISAGIYTFEINPRMEMHFPWFLKDPSPDYTGSAEFELEFIFIPPNQPTPVPPIHRSTVTAKVDPFTDHFPRTVPLPKDPRFMMSPVPAPLRTESFTVPFAADRIEVKLKVVKADVRIQPAQSVVDEVVDGSVFTLSMTSPAPNKTMVWHAEVLDPRINRVFGGTVPEPSDFPTPPLNLSPWRINSSASALTPDGVNSYTSTVLGAAPGLFDDTPTGATLLNYVSNREMFLVGELGYLPIGAWQTVKLISSSGLPAASIVAHPVSDYFSATNSIGVVSTRGLINPNTHEPRVLEALFHLMPADTYPEGRALSDPTAVAVPPAVASLLAGPIARRVSLPGPLGGGVSPGYPYLNPSDAFNTPELYRLLRTNPTLMTLYPNELRRESIFRNSIELMNTRSQFHQILVLVQALGSDGFPLATEKALVQVWRDGISAALGAGAVAAAPHPYVIRQVVYLND